MEDMVLRHQGAHSCGSDRRMKSQWPPVHMNMDKRVCHMQTGCRDKWASAHRETTTRGVGTGAEQGRGLPPRGPMGLAE